MEHSVRMAWWLERAASVPQTEPARIAWLYDWWEKIDCWIQGHAEAGLEPVARQRQRRDPRLLSPESPLADNDQSSTAGRERFR